MRTYFRYFGCLAVLLPGAWQLGCTAPGGPGAFPDEPSATSGAGGSAPNSHAQKCVPARASELLTARSSTRGESSSAKASTMFTQDLFVLFKSQCGACHEEPAKQGDFSVNKLNFRTKVDELVLATIKSNDITKVMPPDEARGMPFSQRLETDPVVEFANLLEMWIKQGRPADLFNVSKANSSQVGQTNKYRVAAEVGDHLTNLGNCIPSTAMFAKSSSTMNDLDAKFATATALPTSLAETDLTSFDSAELIQQGLVAYVPTYPLWSDSAAKLRYIRVPRGQSVKFHKEKQEFEIPANTRFYKTFLKKVIDLSGKETYRKLETRLIVSRPDSVAPDGSVQINSLFGTYVWNDDESEAVLLQDPLNNGKPFRDRMITYFRDEPKAKKIIDSKPPNLGFALNVENPDLTRHYAIPGSQRCIDCHMGGPASGAFILGFSPLQIHRRAPGTGGTYEPAGPDELDQLQRLIDYGLITGISSPSEVTLLENSQGQRKYRNQYELEAQAYMLGNCAHCHNPRGMPSKNDDLREALDFFPRGEQGGIFQFPLERYSKVRKRGAGQDVPMPYITPSIVEFPVAELRTEFWWKKWVNCLLETTDPRCTPDRSFFVQHLHAPWRSLLYRNVDTPFTYTDDFAIFPHMPMHSTSYDCRAPRIMAKWMVSIPARRKRPDINEWAVPGMPLGETPVPYDLEPQPYLEASAYDPDFPKLQERAEERLRLLEASQKFKYCPDDLDIVDRRITGVPGAPLVPDDSEVLDEKGNLLLPTDGVPNRTHFLPTDFSEPPGEWTPRNSSWKKVLVEAMGPADQTQVAEVLRGVKMTQELRTFALTETAFGLWANKPQCAEKLAKVPTVASLPAATRPSWMNGVREPEAAYVYMQKPGETVFNTICRNCHGPQADSAGILSQAISDMTGGSARVANFRSGLFGPIGSSGANKEKVFAPVASATATAEDWAARYLSWMALGGTERRIPASLLSIVSVTGVLGSQRAPTKLSVVGTPNMLKLAYDLCLQVLTANADNQEGSLDNVFSQGRIEWGEETALISANGDADMWLKLCSMGNRPVIRVVVKKTETPWSNSTTRDALSIDPVRSLYFADTYPSDAKVLDHQGRLQMGISNQNFFPVCIAPPMTAAEEKPFDDFLKNNPLGGAGGVQLPVCEKKWFNEKDKWQFKVNRTGDTLDFVDRKIWATRGAANAGFAVFAYLDQFIKGGGKAKPEYNRCEELP